MTFHECLLNGCSVCGAGEGSLTTDCPGRKVTFDKQQEVYETNLDYTDERGWHLAAKNLLGKTQRTPRFEHTEVPAPPPRSDPRVLVAPTIDWARVDRTTNLQHELAKRAIAWVLADRAAEDSSAVCARLEDQIDEQRGRDPNAHTQELHDKFKRATIDFQHANQRSEKCDDEFRQAARRLVTELEAAAPERAETS